jgi:RNA 2',3'-cyclic 3'-phosphodiesterase
MEFLSGTSRLFTAIPVHASITRIAWSFKEHCGAIPGVRWMPEENYHVTFYFIGNVRDADLPELELELTRVSRVAEPFSIQFDAFVSAGHPDRPSMIWARFHRSTDFTRLVGLLRTHCERFILQPAAVFPDPIPHVTLARTSRHNALKSLPEFIEPVPDLNISQLGLWKTHQHAGGVTYEQLHNWNLEAQNAG